MALASPKTMKEMIAEMMKDLEEILYDGDFGEGKSERKLRKCLYKLGIKSARSGIMSGSVMAGLLTQIGNQGLPTSAVVTSLLKEDDDES